MEGERPIPHVDAIAVSDLSKRSSTHDGAVAALEGVTRNAPTFGEPARAIRPRCAGTGRGDG
jgi:hypothetical protein